MRKFSDKKISEMLDYDIIEPSNSEWSSLVIIIPKKDESKLI